MAVPKLQLLSRTQYDTDGTTTVWDFNFSGGYILQDHVKAYYDAPGGVRTTVIVTPGMLIGTWQLQITPAIPAGNVLTIYRATPKDQPMVDFVDRGSISEVALDTLARQAVFVAAEASDDTVTANSEVAVNAAAQAQAAQATATAAAATATTNAATSTAAASTATTKASEASASAAAAAGAVAAGLANPTGVQAINGHQLAGMINLLANGAFQVNVRNYVSGTATTGANQYTFDRWRVVTSGQSLAFTASGVGNSVTAPAGGVEQVIEGVNIAAGTYVLNWTGTATATVNGTARTKGESFTLPANTNATVRLIGGTASLVQLEAGTTVTPFEYLPIPVTRAICRRYARPVIRAAGQCFGMTSAGFWYDTSDMRAAPVLSTTTGFTASSAGGGTTAATVAVATSVNGDTQLNATTGAVLAAGDASVIIPPTGALWVSEL